MFFFTRFWVLMTHSCLVKSFIDIRGMCQVNQILIRTHPILLNAVCCNDAFVSSKTVIKCEEQVLNEFKSNYCSIDLFPLKFMISVTNIS